MVIFQTSAQFAIPPCLQSFQNLSVSMRCWKEMRVLCLAFCAFESLGDVWETLYQQILTLH